MKRDTLYFHFYQTFIIAVQRTSFEHFAAAIAYRIPKDQFNKKLGKKIVDGRLSRGKNILFNSTLNNLLLDIEDKLCSIREFNKSYPYEEDRLCVFANIRIEINRVVSFYWND